jgi:hypothetical protein
LSDLRRQLASARNERDRLRTENAALRSILGDIPPEYAEAFATLCDLAYHGLSPDDLGNPISSHAASRPPKYHPAAYHQRNEERRALRHRSTRLIGMVERLTEGPTVVPHHQHAETA